MKLLLVNFKTEKKTEEERTLYALHIFNACVTCLIHHPKTLYRGSNVWVHGMPSGADLGGGCRGCTPPSPEMSCGFLIQLVFCKQKTMWFIGVEVEQETSAPPPKKNPGSAPGHPVRDCSNSWNLFRREFSHCTRCFSAFYKAKFNRFDSDLLWKWNCWISLFMDRSSYIKLKFC